MERKTVIVTGGSKGIGRELCRLLCDNDCDVIVAGRNEDRGKAVVANLNGQREKPVATFMQLDVGSKESMVKFAENFKDLGKQLFALVNNAGLNLGGKSYDRQCTADGFELTVGTNYLGPFYLTHLLLDSLKASAETLGEARIINVTQSGASGSRKSKKALRDLDLDNLMYHKLNTYSGAQAYKDSKTALVMHTYQLAQQLKGSKVAALAVYPGSVPSTDLSRSASGAGLMGRIAGSPLGRVVRHNKTPEQAAAVLMDVAIGEKYQDVSGKFVSEGALADPVPEAREPELRDRLWQLSAGLLRMEGYPVVELPEVELPPPEPEKPEKSPKKVKSQKRKSKLVEPAADDVAVEEATGEAMTNGDNVEAGDEKSSESAAAAESNTSKAENVATEEKAKSDNEEDKTEEAAVGSSDAANEEQNAVTENGEKEEVKQNNSAENEKSSDDKKCSDEENTTEPSSDDKKDDSSESEKTPEASSEVPNAASE